MLMLARKRPSEPEVTTTSAMWALGYRNGVGAYQVRHEEKEASARISITIHLARLIRMELGLMIVALPI